jgi:uncharacterized protein (DUF169 family)
MGETVLYQCLEFTKDYYGKDMAQAGESGKDVYGWEAAESYLKLGEFYVAFRTRDSARREADAREVPPLFALKTMVTGWEGSTL